jgi:hypothetical protein
VLDIGVLVVENRTSGLLDIGVATIVGILVLFLRSKALRYPIHSTSVFTKS